MSVFIIILLVTSTCWLASVCWEQRVLLKKYRPIIRINKVIQEKNTEKAQLVDQIKNLQTAYKNLKKEHDFYNDDLEMIHCGHYKSLYDFEDSFEYKDELDEIRREQKNLIRTEEAIISEKEWTVEGSEAKGRAMVKRTIKLGLNAFNVQADNIILKVKFNNVVRSIEQLNKIKININKMLSPNFCYISDDFFKLKNSELQVFYEYKNKLQEEKEEQLKIKQQMREEEKVKREIEKAKAKAEEEEEIYEEALDEIRQELIEANDDQKEKYENQIKELEEKLNQAHQKKEKALSMAQQTKRGHVYIISNIGSFGEKIYKIGMTRRLEPEDRVKELGDASVPFEFDIHAMLYSEDAPSLEKKLHESFSAFRMNRVNNRKEFFIVNLEAIENKCKELGCSVEFTKLAQAREYRETLTIINDEKSSINQIKNESEDSIINMSNTVLKKVS